MEFVSDLRQVNYGTGPIISVCEIDGLSCPQRILISPISDALSGGSKSSQSISMPGSILICFSSLNEMYPHSAKEDSRRWCIRTRGSRMVITPRNLAYPTRQRCALALIKCNEGPGILTLSIKEGTRKARVRIGSYDVVWILT